MSITYTAIGHKDDGTLVENFIDSCDAAVSLARTTLEKSRWLGVIRVCLFTPGGLAADTADRPDEFAIEKGAPLPHVPGAAKYRWAEMEIGDSFFVAGKASSQFSPVASQYGKRHGMKFTLRAENGGVRVFRVG